MTQLSCLCNYCVGRASRVMNYSVSLLSGAACFLKKADTIVFGRPENSQNQGFNKKESLFLDSVWQSDANQEKKWIHGIKLIFRFWANQNLFYKIFSVKVADYRTTCKTTHCQCGYFYFLLCHLTCQNTSNYIKYLLVNPYKRTNGHYII